MKIIDDFPSLTYLSIYEISINTKYLENALEFLRFDEVVAIKDELNAAFKDLMQNRLKSIKKNAFQWLFFEACFERTVNGSSYLPSLEQSKIPHYKFELSSTLQRYYAGGTQPVDFVFRLIHKSEAEKNFLDLADELYPETFGYLLMIRDLRMHNNMALSTISVNHQETSQYIQKIITEGFQAEMQAYKRLPRISRVDLLKWYVKNGSAYNEIMSVLKRGQAHKWTITNPYNPSHHLLKSIKVHSLDAESAIVRTREYWYLKWWSNQQKQYVLNYRETNSQSYQLVKTDQTWKIQACLRGIPQTSLSRRQTTYKKWYEVSKQI